MTLVAFLLRQRRFVGRCGLIAVYLSNRQPAVSSEPAKTTMGYYRHLSSAVNETLAKARDVSLGMGGCLMRCWVRYCVCSDCLPSAETVCRCLYGVLVFAFVSVGCPVFVTWIVCRAINLWRRRKRDENSEPFAGEVLWFLHSHINSVMIMYFYSYGFSDQVRGSITDRAPNPFSRDHVNPKETDQSAEQLETGEGKPTE